MNGGMNEELDGQEEYIYPPKTTSAVAVPWLTTWSNCFPPWASPSFPVKWAS